MKKITVLLLFAMLLSYMLPAAFAEKDEPFYRIDRDDPEAWTKELANVRLLTEGRYTLKPLSERYGIDSSFTPSLAGMDALNISGSVQYSEQQFRDLAAVLRECAGGDPIYVVDLRLESHALVNGISISRYAQWNSANKGMTLEEVEADELERFGSMPGTTLTAYSGRGNKTLTLDVENWMTEKELAESEGIGYLRICAQDMVWPDAELIDSFIDFVKGLDMNHVWLHFHCLAGYGRTGIFMCLYDMMKNPDVPLEDIVARQAMTGSEYLLRTYMRPTPGSDKPTMIRFLYQYIQENRESNYEVKWSDWLLTQEVPETEYPEEFPVVPGQFFELFPMPTAEPQNDLGIAS